MSVRRTNTNNQIEPSRFIYVSTVTTRQPVSSLRHWFSLGHHIYDELKQPVVPSAVAGKGPENLRTSMSTAHPRWEDTLDDTPAGAHNAFGPQIGEIDAAEAALAVADAEKAVAEEEEKSLRDKEEHKKEVRARTWVGSRGRYGNVPANTCTSGGRLGEADASQLPGGLTAAPALYQQQFPGRQQFPGQQFPGQQFPGGQKFPAQQFSNSEQELNINFHQQSAGYQQFTPQYATFSMTYTAADGLPTPQAVAYLPQGLLETPAISYAAPVPDFMAPDPAYTAPSQQSFAQTQFFDQGVLDHRGGDFRSGARPPTGPRAQRRGRGRGQGGHGRRRGGMGRGW